MPARKVPGGFGGLRRILGEGIYSGAEAEKYISALERLRPTEKEAFVHDHLYQCLSILDEKASALLAYVGILFAAASITLGLDQSPVAPRVLVFAALVLSGTSVALCLLVIWVHWSETPELEERRSDRGPDGRVRWWNRWRGEARSRRRQVPGHDVSVGFQPDGPDFAQRLMRIRNRRTRAYRTAWLFSQAGLFVFGVGMLVRFLDF